MIVVIVVPFGYALLGVQGSDRDVPGTAAFDGRTCEYLDVLPAAPAGEHPVVAWTRGTALSPFPELLDHGEQIDFIADYRQRFMQTYPPLGDGRVLFPFRRRFFVALRA